MFQELLCPSSGARDYNVDYHIGRFVLSLLCVGGYQCGNQHYSRELLMKGIVVLETC